MLKAVSGQRLTLAGVVLQVVARSASCDRLALVNVQGMHSHPEDGDCHASLRDYQSGWSVCLQVLGARDLLLSSILLIIKLQQVPLK